MKKVKFVGVIAASFFIAVSAFGQEADMDHTQMDHNQMENATLEMPAKAEASGTGVINSVDADKKLINITHEPMPDLNWPTMTMDLPVTKKVDLSNVKAGDKVTFNLKLGRDKKYRITKMEAAK